MNEQKLKEKMRYFFRTRRKGRKAAVEFIKQLNKYGELVIIGGMLRDLSLEGNTSFYSDIDLVINPRNLDEFEEIIKSYHAKQNKYGGYGLLIEKWKIDIWPLEKTWAKTAGYINVEKFSDLLNVTFFNWDAIIYDLQNNNVITHDQYFENLSENILDINLKPSLDPLGNCVRAIRTIYRHHSKLTPTLVRYVNDVLESHSDTAIIFKEKQSHLSSQIQRSDLPILRHQIKQYLKEDVSENFLFHFNNQPELPFYQKTL